MLAKLDVVLAAAGEMLQQIAVHVIRQHAQIDLQAVVVGAQEMPIWVMSAPSSFTLAPGSSAIDFVVPALPELQGAFAVRVEVSDPSTGNLLASCRFPEIFSVNGRQPAGMLAVPYDVRTVE